MKDLKLFWIGVIATAVISFTSGYQLGKDKVEYKFTQYKYDQNQEMIKLQEKYKVLENEHNDLESKYIEKLKDVKSEYEGDINTINNDYVIRLLKSEERADFYRNQAKQGSDGLRDLADHAAKLDKSLEEGRSLVKELRATLKLREEQLITMGHIINNDRSKLINSRG